MSGLILFFAPLLSGLFVFLIPKGKHTQYKLLLVFAGSYLFAITVSHVLPELYREYEDVKMIGLWVLIGFFLQQVLEYFSAGIEHGHIHTDDDHHHADAHHDHSHDETHKVSAYTLLLALCVHAFLEGAMLAQPTSGVVYDAQSVLIGIVLHRIPAAFALMTVLTFQLGSPKKALPFLIIFSAAAPIGLLCSTFLTSHDVLTKSGLIYLYALVCGNFLHISTTIVFESTPGHRFNARKLIVAIVGAMVAIGVEYVM